MKPFTNLGDASSGDTDVDREARGVASEEGACRRYEYRHAECRGQAVASLEGESGPLPARCELQPRAENPALARLESSLRAEGYASYGGDWQCPSCRCRVADARHRQHADLSLRLERDGEAIRLRCSHGCRENTIRAILGMAAYVDAPADPAGAPKKGLARH